MNIETKGELLQLLYFLYYMEAEHKTEFDPEAYVRETEPDLEEHLIGFLKPFWEELDPEFKDTRGILWLNVIRKGIEALTDELSTETDPA